MVRDGKQIIITVTHNIKDKFNIKHLNFLQGNIIQIPTNIYLIKT